MSLVECINQAVDEINRQYTDKEVLFILTGGMAIAQMEFMKDMDSKQFTLFMQMIDYPPIMHTIGKAFLLGAGLSMKGEL